MKLAVCFGLVFMGTVLPAFPTLALDTSCSAVAPQVQKLLTAYSHKDIDDVLDMADPHALLVLGTDASEIADSRPAVMALLKADFMLWGSSEFGRPGFMSCRVSHR